MNFSIRKDFELSLRNKNKSKYLSGIFFINIRRCVQLSSWFVKNKNWIQYEFLVIFMMFIRGEGESIDFFFLIIIRWLFWRIYSYTSEQVFTNYIRDQKNQLCARKPRLITNMISKIQKIHVPNTYKQCSAAGPW